MRAVRWRFRQAVVVGLIGVLGPGCSWTFIQRGPERARYGESIPCSEGKLLPIVDAAIAVLYPVGAGIRLAAGDVRRENSDGSVTIDPAPSPLLLLPLALVGGALFGWSAWSGHVDTNHCAALRRERLRTLDEQDRLSGEVLP